MKLFQNGVFLCEVGAPDVGIPDIRNVAPISFGVPLTKETGALVHDSTGLTLEDAQGRSRQVIVEGTALTGGVIYVRGKVVP